MLAEGESDYECVPVGAINTWSLTDVLNESVLTPRALERSDERI